MPILQNNPGLEQILRDLTVQLPGIDVKEIDVAKLMEFNIHSLEEQFKSDLLAHSFFGLLAVEIAHKIQIKKGEWQDFENELSSKIRDSAEEKMTEAKIKLQIELNITWRAFRDTLASLKYQEATVSALCSALQRKSIALNVFTAKTRAELSAGLGAGTGS